MAMQLSFSLLVFGSPPPPVDPGLVGENFPYKDDENKQEEEILPFLYLFPAGAGTGFGPIFSIQPFRSTSCGPTRNQPASYNTITVKVKNRSSFFVFVLIPTRYRGKSSESGCNEKVIRPV